MLKKSFIIVTPLIAIVLAAVTIITNPTIKIGSEESGLVEVDSLRQHVLTFTELSPSRNAQNIEQLNQARDYIVQEFESTGCQVRLQEFIIQGNDYANVICTFGGWRRETTIIGAHYDVHFEDNPGADDNASGVAGILEIARLVGENPDRISGQVDIIAYTLEELPHFRKESMGSMVHAKELYDNGQEIKAMISMEMIGYFSDEKGSQSFPMRGLKYLYPDRGNFIAIIGRIEDFSLIRSLKIGMKGGTNLPVYSMSAPRALGSINFSDHASYWDYGFPAVMVTDTSFLRNPHYHKSSDTIETLDFERMAKVVEGVYSYLTTN